ncbi:MAG: UDP-N-acetylmuramate dehydrogenase [Candidatus Paceibacterota bacterium]
MQIRENIPLAPHTTLKLGGSARYFATLTETSDVSNVFRFAKECEVEVFMLGGGSNTIFADGVIDKLVVRNQLCGISFEEIGDEVIVTAAAGESWDELVKQAVAGGFSGIEALSGIPGTVGAAPVQNIGAYGAQLADTFVSLTAWDKEHGEFREFTPSDCDFSYRNSLFKRQFARFFITELKLRLQVDQSPSAPDYGSLQAYLEKNRIENPDLTEIRDAIVAVRSSRLPNVETTPNAGSFFTNPVIDRSQADELEDKFPDLVRFDLKDGQVKIPAGWLIEKAGLKGKSFGNFRTSADNALVLIHDGGGTTTELLSVQGEIKKRVEDMFGIVLEREPNYVS